MDTEFVLVDQYDNIRNRATLSDSVGISGAKTYFMKIKQIDKNSFKKKITCSLLDSWSSI